ncbi:MAG: glycoside hydrolase family 3 C-terminal domain-containing protein [Balneolales bacterium]
MRNLFIIFYFFSCISLIACSQSDKVQKTDSEVEKKIDDLMEQLTLEEKVHLLHGKVTTDTPLRFESGGVERLGIKQIEFLDGPVGIRDFDPDQKTTALPSTLSLSCTWDTDAASKFASVIASELLYLDKHVLFGPGVNLMRSPLGGRNFEYMGEDPYLTGTMATHYINAVQKHGIAANAKHFLANDIDRLRHFTSSNLDDRTLREMHLMPFEMAVTDADVWTIMSGNNLVNGVHAAENKRIAQEILKDELGFDGVYLTDWRAAYSAVNSAFGGTDMTLGFGAYVYGDGNLLEAVNNGDVPISLVDEKVRRVLRLYYRTGVIEPETRGTGEINTQRHHDIARAMASQGMVLLKNNGSILPLDTDNQAKIMVTGPAADIVPVGTGSSRVDSEISITPLQGLREVFNESNLTYLPYQEDELDELISGTASHDYVLFFVSGGRSGEGMDMQSLELPGNQADALRQISAVHDKVIVVTLSAGPFDMQEWIDEPEAILSGWFAGQATGQAIADVLTGKVNPGGKLSFTIARQLNDYAVHSLGEWPQKPILDTPPRNAPADPKQRVAIHGYDLDYTEGVFMGYRWFDKESINPLFPFGYGLSYTTFKMEDAGLDLQSDQADKPQATVKVKVTNTGDKAGSEVVQVYIGDPESSVPRPERELKGFKKVWLNPGESEEVSISLDKRSFAFWNEKIDDWDVEPGEFIIEVGNSSRNPAFSKTATIQ